MFLHTCNMHVDIGHLTCRAATFMIQSCISYFGLSQAVADWVASDDCWQAERGDHCTAVGTQESSGETGIIILCKELTNDMEIGK